MKHLHTCCWSIALLACALSMVSPLQAADSKTNAADKATSPARESTEAGKPKRDWYPFYGTVAATDLQAHTLSLKKKEGVRLLKLDSKSTLEIGGKPAVLGSVKVGDYAHGTLHKDSAGVEVIRSAKFDKTAPNQGPVNADKDPQKPSAAKPKP